MRGNNPRVFILRILLNDRELGALYGLPYAVICLYVMAIRPRMDYATGMLGIRPLISWQALTEWLYIEPRPGIKGGGPSRWAVMRQARQLEAAGLVRIASSIANSQLIFECKLADRAKLAPNKAATKPQAKAATPSGADLHRGRRARQDEKAATGESGKAAIHPGTGSSNDRYHNLEGTYTGVIWPTGLNPIERSAVAALLKKNKINEKAQILLDELAGAMQQKPVSNKVAYASALCRAMQRGEFTPEKAHLAESARATRKNVEASIARASEPVKVTPRDLERGAAMLAEIRKRLKGRKK